VPSVLPSPTDVLRGVITTLAVGGVIALLSLLTGILDAAVPLWLVIAVAVLVPVAFLAGRVAEAGENLEPFYVDHVKEVLDTLQKIVAGDIPDVSAAAFIERGILAPARQWLVTAKGSDEEVRLSVLVPEGDQFSMLFEAGHSVEARQKFELSTAGSFAGHALVSGEMQWTNDVDADPRWTLHPKARPGREYGSFTCAPIRVGDEIVAILSVLSTEKNAFLPSELMYIDVLGSIIGVAWSLASPTSDVDVGGD
jgi:GAF domain-containing protein